jgi:hypothetical protein
LIVLVVVVAPMREIRLSCGSGPGFSFEIEQSRSRAA